MKKTYIIFTALFCVFLLFSCDSGLKFENPNDPNNQTSDSKKTGTLGGECYPNKTCNEGLTCDKENNICIEEPDNTNDDDETNTDSGNDDEESISDDSNSTDTTPDNDTDNQDEPITTDCQPGETRKCAYQGPEGTEDVGPCKAGISTCKENGTWGRCEGAVEPVLETGEEFCTNGIDDDCDGTVDNGINNACSYWNNPETPDTDSDSASDPGIIDVGYTGDYDDAYHIPVDATEIICTDTCIPMQAECLPVDIVEGEVDSVLCNGLDDDCDGKVDEGCPCSPGQTQACFLGPKNYRNRGTCQDGVQTCKVSMRGTRSVGVWGECVGGISPKQDVCDNADNNCNGCPDDKLCCAPPIDCSFDIGTATPFADKIIDGTQIYDTGHTFNDTDTATWEWTLTKGPCDEVLGKVNSYMKGAKTQEELGTLAESDRKTVLNGLGLSQLKLRFRLSGSYKLHLKVTRENGEVYECEWILKVVSAGLRIELCWDTNTEVDADLHLGKNGVTTGWTNNTACLFSTKNPDWGYPKTDNYDKDGNWKTSMNNPRLDIDNIAKGPIPENINLDNPEPDDVFRVGVRYYPAPTTSNNKPTHPVVNVYCGGTLKATYGVEPQVSNFNSKDDFWKVVEIKWVGDYLSDACELTPRWDDSTGYVVNSSIPTYTSWFLTDQCEPNPCSGIENSTGKCTATGDTTYSCTCKTGYTGVTCEECAEGYDKDTNTQECVAKDNTDTDTDTDDTDVE